VQNYVRQYKESIGILPKESAPKRRSSNQETSNPDIETYMSMSKEELIAELIKAKANELRAKKGYEVKGDGANREYISLSNKNLKS
jgi:transposase